MPQARLVIVVLSDKYLQSPYCMTEVHTLYKTARQERQEFLNRIIPLVLTDATRIGTWRDRAVLRTNFGFLRKEKIGRLPPFAQILQAGIKVLAETSRALHQVLRARFGGQRFGLHTAGLEPATLNFQLTGDWMGGPFELCDPYLS